MGLEGTRLVCLGSGCCPHRRQTRRPGVHLPSPSEHSLAWQACSWPWTLSKARKGGWAWVMGTLGLGWAG